MADEISPQAGPSVPALQPSPDPRTKFSTALTEGESAAPFGGTNTGEGIPLDVQAQRTEQESGWQASHGPKPSRWNVFTGTAADALSDSMGGAALRLIQERNLPDGTPPISPETANKLFPNRETPYTTPVDPRIVGMEQQRAASKQEQDEWLSEAPGGFLTGASRLAGGLAGGLLSPENILTGALSGGLADLLLPSEIPAITRFVARYGVEVGGFTSQAALTNDIEQEMGAKKADLGTLAQEQMLPAAIGTAAHVALKALARAFADMHAEDITPDALKKGIVSLERGEKMPSLDEDKSASENRANGMTQNPHNPQAPLEPPSMVTSPVAQSKLYSGIHADGSPHIFERGLGLGIQLTDTAEAAEHTVGRDNVPGRVVETKLAEGSKLLDLDTPVKEDLRGENSFLKEIETKTGAHISESAEVHDATLKEAIQNLGDHAGVGDIPKDVLQQVQDIAKERGYSGYEFGNGVGATARTAHIFDPSPLELSKSHLADPDGSPSIQSPGTSTGVPSEDAIKEGQRLYSPELEQMLREEHSKGERFDPYSDRALTQAQTNLEGYKKQLSELAKTSDTAAQMHEALRQQAAEDSRLMDIAKRITECGAGGGV